MTDNQLESWQINAFVRHHETTTERHQPWLIPLRDRGEFLPGMEGWLSAAIRYHCATHQIKRPPSVRSGFGGR